MISPARASTTQSPPLDRVDAAWGLGVFAFALVLRLVYLHEIESLPFVDTPLIDAGSYDDWARRIAGGDWWGDAVFYQAPAYPYFLAVVYRAFGAELSTAYLVQMVLGACSCGLMYGVARVFFERSVGLAAGLMLAVYPPAIFFDGVIQKAGLGLFVMTAMLLGLALFQRHPRARIALACGALLGVLALTRENTLVFAPAIPIWIALRFRERAAPMRLRWIAAFVLGVALILAPVALRNHAIGGRLSLTTSQLGPNFYIGNHSGATGVYAPLLPGRSTPEFEGPDAAWLAEQAVGRELSPAEVSDYWLGEGLAFVRDAPGEWLALLVAKAMMAYNDFEIPDTEDLYVAAEASPLLGGLLHVFHFGVLLPLAVMGMIVGWKRRPDTWLLYGLIALFSFAVVLFYVFARYRYPLVPLMLPFAGLGVVELVRRLRARAWDEAAVLAIVAAMVALVCNRALFDETPYRATAYANLGYIMLSEGRLQEAQKQLSRAQSNDPTNPEIQLQLAVLHYRGHRLDEAAALLREILEVEDRDPRPHRLLAKILEAQGNEREALHHRREAARLNPDRGRDH